MTLPEATVYADILANPDDDGPRRVYADHLIERGDPRGELIVVQCELASCGKQDVRRAELEHREGELIGEAGARWRTALGLPDDVKPFGHDVEAVQKRGNTCVLRRGLIEEIKLDVAQLTQLGDTLARIPLRKLVAMNITDAGAAALAGLPAMPTLAQLRIRDGRLGIAGAGALVGAPLLRAVSELELHRVTFETEAVGYLGRGDVLRSLVSLALIDIHAHNLAELADAVWLPQLQSLLLQNVYGNVPELVASDRFRDLRRLDLDSCYLTDVELAAIPIRHVAPLLTHLILPALHLGDEAARAFVRSRRLDRLERLEFRGYSNVDSGHVTTLRERFGDRLAFDGTLHLLP